MEKFTFDPPTGFQDVDAFPDPLNESETREQLQRLHSQLAEFVNMIAPGYNGEVVMIRFDNDLRLEYSLDGEEWVQTLSSGHIVIDQNGDQFPNRKRIQFFNAVIKDDPDNDYTIVECSTGEAGPGVPTGGEAYQVLAKKSDNSYDTEWKTLTAEDIGAVSTEELEALRETKADSEHNHDGRYYTEAEITSLLENKSNTTHTHDGRYYTETEIDTKLSAKADASALGTQVTYSLSGTTLTITTK